MSWGVLKNVSSRCKVKRSFDMKFVSNINFKRSELRKSSYVFVTKLGMLKFDTKNCQTPPFLDELAARVYIQLVFFA
jgi:hypothetical protein